MIQITDFYLTLTPEKMQIFMKRIFLKLVPFLTALFVSGCIEEIENKHVADEKFNSSWLFIKADSVNAKDIENSLLKGESVIGMRAVKLPHTANIEPLVVNNQWQGICYYMKKL